MLTNDDIVKLSRVLATKEDLKDFYKKDEIDTKFNKLYTVIDKYMSKTKTYHEEHIVLKSKVSGIESWVKQSAEKVGVEYNP